MPAPPPPASHDAATAALAADVDAAAARVECLRRDVPARLHVSAAALQGALRAAAAAATAAAAAAAAPPCIENGDASAGGAAGALAAAGAAAGALVPVDLTLSLTTELEDAVAALPAVQDRLQARGCRAARRGRSLPFFEPLSTSQVTPHPARAEATPLFSARRRRWRACSAWWARWRRTPPPRRRRAPSRLLPQRCCEAKVRCARMLVACDTAGGAHAARR
jgi:hypothetical protein